MKFSRDRYDEVVSAMREEGISSLSSGIKSRYSFDFFCESNNLFNDTDKIDGTRMFISCPLHSDKTPSCSIDSTRWIWKCFSCGEGGDFIEFVRLYWNYSEGAAYTKARTVDRLLRDDLALQSRLGYSSVYEGDGFITVGDIQIPEKPKLVLTGDFPSSYAELASRMKQRKESWQKIKLAILMAQENESPESIWKEVNGAVEVNEKFNLADLESIRLE